MNRARCEVEPTIPVNNLEFIQTTLSTLFDTNYAQSVALILRVCISHCGLILFSQKMSHELARIDTISFHGTFYTFQKQFEQLWTVFGIFISAN